MLREAVLLTTAHVARVLSCSESQVRVLANAGALPVAARTTGGVRLFERSAVELYRATVVDALARRANGDADAGR